MLSSNIYALALTLLTSIAQGKVIMSVVGQEDPLNTVVSTKLESNPNGEVSFLPSSADPSVLFSDCGLTFNSTNYNVPQEIHLRRKTFTPFATGRSSEIPDQVFDLILSEIGTTNLYTLPIRWRPNPSKIVSFWGDLHFDKVIDDLAPNGQGSFLDSAVVQMPRSKYFSVIKSKTDWEVTMFTFPYGAATTHTRLCVRNVNNVICANGDGTITYLNPASQNTYPIEVMKVGNEIQFLLPSGSAVETVPNPLSMTTRITIQPSDLGGLSGIGNNTLLHFTTAAISRKAFVNGFELPEAIQIMMNAPNMTNNLQFSSASFVSSLSFSACIPGVSIKAEPFVRKLIISSSSTITESVNHHITNLKFVTHVVGINVTISNTNWTSVTQDSVTVKETTTTKPMTASVTVTATSSATVTSNILVEETVAVGLTSTVYTQAFATSTNIVGETVLVEINTTRTNNYESVVTNVVTETETTSKTDYKIQVDTKYLTSTVRGADVTETVNNYETDTTQRTFQVTSTKNIDELLTIVGQESVNVTRVIEKTTTVELHHKVTDTIHSSEDLETTVIRVETLVNTKNVTTTAVDMEYVTSTRLHTSTLSTTTNVQVLSTLVKDEEVTTHTTFTIAVSSTEVATAQHTTTIRDEVHTTTTEVVDQTHIVGQTNSHTATLSHTSQEHSTKTETLRSTIETQSKFTVYHQTQAEFTSTHVQTINIDKDSQETLTDIEAINAVVYTTLYNPVVVYVTTNQTDGTTTFTETNFFTETATVTKFADPILTTITAQA